MTVVQLNGSTVGTYTYNALGQRIAKTSMLPQVSSQRFAYDEGSQLIGEYGTINRDYIWMAGLPVAMVDTNGTTSTFNYVHADGLGTPRAISNAAGITQWLWSYQGNPFGEQQPTSSSGYVFNLRFPGQYFNLESGLVTNGFRDCYEPATGRYCQSDPMGLNGGISTYAYVGGNPLVSVDPTGLADEDEEEMREVLTETSPFVLTQLKTLMRQIRAIDPDYAYQTIGPAGSIRYTEADVEFLASVLRDMQREAIYSTCPAVQGSNVRGALTNRSTFRNATVQKAWDNAEPGPNGGRLCFTCKTEVLVPPFSGEKRDWDGSHVPSWTNRYFPTSSTRQDIINAYQEGVRLECIGCNRSGQNNDGRFNK
ncbi:RHS repeat-associated core domain-containing protein, partial [Dyella silvatica]|uniref:RHS repeat-associated core domain-containing protein n=1 Tax=Dyella silvatica TaxID=2992128 RepID=UPI002B1CD5C1